MDIAIDTWTDRDSLLTGGLSERQIDDLRRSGVLSRLRPGRYVESSAWASLSPEQRHRIRAQEFGTELAGRAAISHESAALFHGLQLPPLAMPRIHVTWPGSPGRRGTRNIHPHRGRLEDCDVVQIDGVLVTTIARTVFDVARSAAASVAISAADSSLRCGWTSRNALAAILERSPRTTGHPRAQRIIEFADPRSESVGESICRLRMAQLGLPSPALQVVVPGLGLDFDARVDFEISKLRTVVEFDGRIKYGRLLKPDEAPGDVVFREKRREDAIRGTGRECIRIVWDELTVDRYAAVLLPRFTSAFARAGYAGWRPGPGKFLTG